MELSRQELIQLLEQLESHPDPEEVRRTSRVLIRRRLKIITCPSDPACPEIHVVLQDISRGGVCFTHHEGMPRDKQFVLLLPASDGGQTSVACTVRYCQMVKQHLFRIGAQFDAIASPRGASKAEPTS